MNRRRRILVVLAAVPLLLVLALGWLLGTTAGLHFALARAEQATGGALHVQASSGRLAGTVTLEGLRFHAAGGPDVRVQRVELDLATWDLLRGRVHLASLFVHSLDVTLPAQPSPAPAKAAPFDPRAPVHLVFDRVRVDGLRVHRGKADLFAADRVDLAGAWTRDGVEVSPLRVRAPDGSIDADARMAFTAGHPGNARIRFDWTAAGRHWQGHLQAHGDGRQANARIVLDKPSPAHAELTLSTRAPYAWTAKLTLPRAASTAWLGAGHGIRRLAASLQAHGDVHQVHATGRLDLDATRVQLAALDARLADGGKRVHLEHLTLRSPQQPGTLDASGEIDLGPPSPRAKLQVGWKDVTLPARLAGRALATHGTLAVDGTLRNYRATLDAVAGPPGQPAKLTAQAKGTPDQLQVEQLTVQQAKGRLQAHGVLHYAGPLAWQLEASAHGFDPGMLRPDWNGALDARLTSKGSLGKGGRGAQLDLGRLAGRLRGQSVAGHGRLALSPQRVLSGQLDVRVGASHLALSGAAGTRNDLQVDLHVGALEAWVAGARGTLAVRGHVRGTWPRLALKGQLDGTALDWHDQRAGQLSARFDLPDVHTPGGSVHLAARDLHAGGFAFKTLQVDAHGNARAHSLAANASGDPLSLRLALHGGMQGRSWKGRLTRLDLGLADHPDWHLAEPVALAWGNGTASLGLACLEAGQPRLCVSARRQRTGALEASYRMRQLPLALPLALAGNDLPMRATGTLDGDGDIKRSAGGALSGQATIRSGQGSVSYTDHPQEPLLDYRKLDARLHLAPSGQQLTVTAALQRNGTLDANLRAHGPRQSLDGHVRVHLDNLHFVELFTTAVANLKGQLDADLALAGTLQAPGLRGSASLADLSGEIPALGLKLAKGRVTLKGDPASALQVDGQVQSGKGTLTLAGSAGLGAGQSTRLTLRGQQVEVANLPSATVSLSPDVRVQGNAKGLAIDGQVKVDRADVNLEKLPGNGATQASPDVVVVDAPKPPPAGASALPVTTDVTVELGEHAHVTGYGLDGNLHGSLRVDARPGKQAQGQGQIRIDGTFRAYGQDLSITRGRLLFASTPLDNPGLDIRAVRKLNPNATVDDGQQVGLEVRGTARRPELTVFSNPAMEQSDALSYLITGKPLSQVKGGEGSMVDSAAQALGSATGDLLAKSVGARLGISDIGVSSNQALGTTAFTVGKYLSPRLYLSYGVGLFEPGQVVTLRYILSRRWNFEAQQSTNASRASFNYRYEH